MSLDEFWLVGHKIIPINFSEQLDAAIICTPPNTDGPPPHFHANYDEIFFIQEGELEFLIDGEIFIQRKGDCVFIPKNTIHTFKNKTKLTVKSLNLHTPKGFLSYMQSAGIASSEANAKEKSVSLQSIQKLVLSAEKNDMIISKNVNAAINF